MTGNAKNILQQIFKSDSLEDISEKRLKDLRDQYPFFTSGHYLLSKKLYKDQSADFLPETKKTALYFDNPYWLQWLLKKEEYTIPEETIISTKKINTDFNTEILKKEPVDISAPELVEKDQITEKSMDLSPIIEEIADNENPVQEYEIKEQNNEPAKPIVENEAQKEGHSYSFMEEPNEENIAIYNEIPETASLTTLHETTITNEPQTSIPEIESTEQDQEPSREMIEPNQEPISTIVNKSNIENEIKFENQVLETDSMETTTNQEQSIEPETPIQEPTIEQKDPQYLDSENPDLENTIQEEAQKEPNSPNDLSAIKNMLTHPQDSKETEFVFDSYHTVDYFAALGIKLNLDEPQNDKLGKQLKSFTDWLKTMKKLPQKNVQEITDEQSNNAIEGYAAHSILQKEIITEAMADVFAKQGKTENAIDLYKKLSLLNPSKSTYFASKIEQINRN